MTLVNFSKQHQLQDYSLLNSIRTSSDTMYQRAVPLANENNVAATSQAIAANPYTFNIFYNAINKLAMSAYFAARWTDPLNKIFSKGDLGVGDTLESTFVDFVDEHLFGYTADDQNSVMSIERPEVTSYYSKLNRKSKYKTTYSQVEARQIMTAGGSIQQIIDKIVGRLRESSERDSTRYIKAEIARAIDDGSMIIREIDYSGDDNANLLNLVETARQDYLNMPWVDNDNPMNWLGVDNPTPSEDIITLFDAKTRAAIDTRLMSGAYNQDKVDFLGSKTVINSLGSNVPDNVVGVMMDRNFVQVWNYLDQMAQFTNPATLTENTWLHIWRLYTHIRFFNAVVYVKKTPASPVAYNPQARFYCANSGDNILVGNQTVNVPVLPLYRGKLQGLLTAGRALQVTLSVNIDNTTTALGPTAAVMYDGTAQGPYVGNGNQTVAKLYTAASSDGKTPASPANFDLSKISLDVKGGTSDGDGTAYSGTINAKFEILNADGSSLISDTTQLMIAKAATTFG